MKKWLIQNSSKIAKVCTIIGLVLIICYVAVIMNDWNIYRMHLGTTFATAGPAELKHLSDAFMIFASERFPMFLIPAAACGITAVIMQFVPKAARERMHLEEQAAAPAKA